MKGRHYYAHKKKDKKTMFDTTLHQKLKIVHDELHLKNGWKVCIYLIKGKNNFWFKYIESNTGGVQDREISETRG